jgi:NADPH-dependent glutamate synthase beta subunit-like oxidoreductase
MKKYRVPREEFIVPRCSQACPAGVDVPRYIRAVEEGRFDDAVAVLRERLPLPTVCADACFAPCEDACAFQQYGDPVAIRALKRAAVDHGGDAWLARVSKSPASGKKVAVVGAGPAGLTVAYYLAGKGHGVTMFDAFDEPGGTMRYGVPAYRLPKDRLAADVRYILDRGVEFMGNTRVGQDMGFDDLTKNFDAVFIGCGAMAETGVSLDGAGGRVALMSGEFLKDVAQGKPVDVGARVVVIGGGNSAVDAARTARRLGAAKVTLVYRRTREEMPAHPEEVAAAVAEGVEIMENWSPSRLISDGDVTAMGFVRCASEGNGGRDCQLVYDEEVRIRVDADTVIVAAGQKADLDFLGGAPLESPEKGVFAGGDAKTGPDSIVGAIAQGRAAAEAIDRYLGGTGDVSETLAPAEDEVELTALDGSVVPRQQMPCLPVWLRTAGFEQVETGLGPAQVKMEAGRCLSCDARKFEVALNTENCKECGYCVEVCGVQTFGPADSFNSKGYRPMECKTSDWCVGCFKCFFACPDFAIDVKEACGGPMS